MIKIYCVVAAVLFITCSGCVTIGINVQHSSGVYRVNFSENSVGIQADLLTR